MNLDNALNEYPNCLYYNKRWHILAQNGDIDCIVNIGSDFARCEMMDYAVACWQYVIDIGRGTAEVYSNLGVSYYYGNGVIQDYKKAVHYYQKAAAKNHPFGIYNLAVACENGNGTPQDLEKAIKYYKMAADKGVNMAIDALIRLGLYDEIHGFAYYGRNLNDDSFTPNNNYRSCINNAQNKYSSAIAEYGTVLGEVFKNEAIQFFLKAISYDETSEAYYGLASLYKDFKDFNNAIKYYKETIRINPSSFESYNDMGYCYYQLEDYINALECFKKSYDISPNSMVLRNMGNCYKNLRKIDQSEDCYYNANMLENGLTF